MTSPLRLAELLGTLSLASDLGIGQPPEYLLRTCLVSAQLTEHLQLSDDDQRTVYYTSLLRWIGCTGHAHETSLLFGDEITARAHLALVDPGSRGEVLRFGLRDLGAGQGARGHVAALVRSGQPELRPEGQFRASCEVAQLLCEPLRIAAPVRAALLHAFERWDGRGQPNHIQGSDIPLAARIVLLSQDAVVLDRELGRDAALEVIKKRSGHAYDPALATAFSAAAAELLAAADVGSAWTAVLACEPGPHQDIASEELDTALEATADYADLKSPWTAGHSRHVAELASAAASVAGMPASDCTALRRAGLVHDLGRCGVHNGIWDKPGALTDAEWERVRLHPYLTGRLLSRAAALAPLGAMASAHHERPDGSGYHRGAHAPELSMGMRVLAAADAYAAMTESRPHRPAMSPSAAASQLRDEVRAGRQDSRGVDAVLTAAGHARRRRAAWPDSLTAREVEVLQLVASGLPNRETARRLSISERTVAHHIQHVYDKIGVSTRGAAVLYALQHGLADPPARLE
jgi:HD-GYP domain-containing protein (c-di-GMP phosphodiesterase class II)